jgi:hypothetical protein
VSLAALLGGACAPATDGGDGPPLDLDLTWEEEDDSGNEHAGNAEEVDVPWQRSVTISGEMTSCSYDGTESWPWTGDNDNYRVEVPEEGYIEVLLDWDSNSDLDLMIYFEPPGSTAEPDWSSNSSDTSGGEEYLFDEMLNRGDDIVLGVACAGGSSDDYTLLVNWET